MRVIPVLNFATRLKPKKYIYNATTMKEQWLHKIPEFFESYSRIDLSAHLNMRLNVTLFPAYR